MVQPALKNILILGNGGREHALAWKIAQSDDIAMVYVAPGNGGSANEPKVSNVPINATDISKLIAFAKTNHIDLTIVGPEAPLVIGVVDAFQAENLAIFGPTQAAAQLEGSKAFTKDFLARHAIPTARYANFTDKEEAINYVKSEGAPIVIKADGLAAGKGVIVAMTEEEAIASIEDMLSGNKFGDAGSRVVIEEFLSGEEASFIVMADGVNVLPMATSQDHKRVGDGDTGPNTGGMGAYSPAPVVTQSIHDRVMKEIIYPTIQGMAKEGMPYTGFLYAGLMIDETGQPKVIEFNCRFGDPETQPIMMRLQGDLVQLCQLAIQGMLNKGTCQWDERAAVGVVMASKGYPDAYESHHVITGLPDPKAEDKNTTTKVFHAGTQLVDGQVITTGGRVLCVTALGKTVSAAQHAAYAALEQIDWHGAFYRKDIAYRAIQREQ